jgi:hypothetical protein
MNMRLEEYQQLQASKSLKKAPKAPTLQPAGKLASSHREGMTMSSCESFISLDEPPKDYELMLQKYEAEVRNHIKIEQQLKLHIEVLQDKIEDAEKLGKDGGPSAQESVRELKRYRELLDIREKEVE